MHRGTSPALRLLMSSAEGCATCVGRCPITVRAAHSRACLLALRDGAEYPSCDLYLGRYWHGVDGVSPCPPSAGLRGRMELA